MEFSAPFGPLPFIPDDLTVPQFLLDSRHPVRPLNQLTNPWFIEEDTGRSVGFEEVRARTYGLANALSIQYNIKANDAVCIFSPNHIDYPVAMWAIHRLGAVVTCANPAYTPNELKYQLELTEACLLFTHSDSLAAAQEAARASHLPLNRIVLVDNCGTSETQSCLTLESLVYQGLAQKPNFTERRLSPGEARTKLAMLSFSSGTTGRPKAVAVPHYALIANIIQGTSFVRTVDDYKAWEDRRYRPGDVIYAVLPFYHSYGAMVILHFFIFYGFSLVVPSRFNFLQMLKSIERYRVNHLALVPPMILLLCKNPATKQHDLSSVRFLMSAAAPLSPELTTQVTKVLPHVGIGQAYGLTESATALSLPRLDVKISALGSSGRLLPGVVAKVIKEDGTLAGFDEAGELYVRTPSIALGYYKDAEATRETFVDGWLRTGDEVIINQDYEVFIVDRKKEIFKVRGSQVAPAELEGHLLNHPYVADTCVVGVPDEYSGEVPLAFVVLSPPALEQLKMDPSHSDKLKDEIKKFVADAKVHYKRLAGGVEFIDAIPKNPSGKLLRRLLRDKARELQKVRYDPAQAKL